MLPEGLWKGEWVLQISHWKVVIKFNDSTDAGGVGSPERLSCCC